MVNNLLLIHPTKCAGTSISKKILELQGYSNYWSNYYSGYSFNRFFQKNIQFFYFIFYSKNPINYLFYLIYYITCLFFHVRNSFSKHYFGLSCTQGSYQHFTYRQWQKIKTAELKICVVNHPQHRIVSSYYFLGYDKHYSFIEFLKKIKNGSLLSKIQFSGFQKIVKQHFIPMYDYIVDDDGNKKIDVILKRESLENDWYELCNKYNLKYSPLQHINKTKKIMDWKKIYKYYPSAVNLVYEIYEKDFIAFNYKIIES